ncbi:50S ribosomal protein L20 [candidate division WWE3 bacterium]|jgi:large subunit ribosomal protein L20|uniref:Large ribosomal subunit protein bL20 n=1 Tax=candidate division WWE3 bacterium TaxID=2053526 RepID=A0A3A4ZDV2_UNCKA|nr:MAG: 50S ribosomal protein L20 [candidate division WWE3 bacterium]
MPRVKGGPRAHRKHRKIIKLAKGYRGSRNRLYRRASEAVERAVEHSFAGRKQKRRDFRRLWIARINAALTGTDLNYSRFIKGLKTAKIDLNRKTLSEMAINNPKAFEEIVSKVKSSF